MKSLNRIITPFNMFAMFAAFSEASAATTLPYLDDESRKFFIGFIVIFPCALSAMWFVTLHFKSGTLDRAAEPAQTSHPTAISRVVYAGVLSTALDAGHFTSPRGTDSISTGKENQFEVLLIERA
jgi:hypothetical protein